MKNPEKATPKQIVTHFIPNGTLGARTDRLSLQRAIEAKIAHEVADMAWIISSILDTIEPTDPNFDKIMSQVIGREYEVEEDYKANLEQRQADKERLQDHYDNVRRLARQYDKEHTGGSK